MAASNPELPSTSDAAPENLSPSMAVDRLVGHGYIASLGADDLEEQSLSLAVQSAPTAAVPLPVQRGGRLGSSVSSDSSSDDEDDDEADTTPSCCMPGPSRVPTSAAESTIPLQPETSRKEDGTARLTRGFGALSLDERKALENRRARDFFFIRTLNEGTFSTVYYAREGATGREFAIKVMQKHQLRSPEKMRLAEREKNIMAHLTFGRGGHPFVNALHCAFEDRDHLYLAVGYCGCGDLQQLLRRVGCFDESTAKFYSAELLLGLEFLHSNSIIHRDIKPENLLLDARTHLVIADFGSAKWIGQIPEKQDREASDSDTDGWSRLDVPLWRETVKRQESENHDDDDDDDDDNDEDDEAYDDEEEFDGGGKQGRDSGKGAEKNHGEIQRRSRASTFVGTAHYVSPEMLDVGNSDGKRRHVGPPCDYWALGAVVFHMLAGLAPFRAANDYQVMNKIKRREFAFPPGFPDTPRDLVNRLLSLNPVERLGSEGVGGVAEIQKHAFYEGIEWTNLHRQDPPRAGPYLPASDGEPAFYSSAQDGAGFFPQFDEAGDPIEPGLDAAALKRLLLQPASSQLQVFTSGSRHPSAAQLSQKGHHSPSQMSEVDEASVATGTTECGARLPIMFPGIPFYDHSTGKILVPEATSIAKPTETIEEKRIRLAAIRTIRLERQSKESPYHKFVENNLIFKFGVLDKKKGLFARRRMFLLTEGPHLYYVDPVHDELKGEIPFSSMMRTEAKNFRTFFVHTPHRTYYLFDPLRTSVEWCRAIDTILERYRPVLEAREETIAKQRHEVALAAAYAVQRRHGGESGSAETTITSYATPLPAAPSAAGSTAEFGASRKSMPSINEGGTRPAVERPTEEEVEGDGEETKREAEAKGKEGKGRQHRRKTSSGNSSSIRSMLTYFVWNPRRRSKRHSVDTLEKEAARIAAETEVARALSRESTAKNRMMAPSVPRLRNNASMLNVQTGSVDVLPPASPSTNIPTTTRDQPVQFVMGDDGVAMRSD